MTPGKICVVVLLASFAIAQNPSAPVSSKEIDNVYSDSHSLYLDLHEHPELSGHEVQTASKLATALRKAGYEVTEHIGGTGIVAILKNGPGPTIMLRTEDPPAHDVPVMQDCGHALHTASLLGTPEIMARSKNTCHGTLTLIGQ